MDGTARAHGLTPELAAWQEARLSRLKIARTTITPHGQTLDWIPIESQTTEPIASPPPTDGAPAAAGDVNRPTVPVTFEAIEPGPAAHVPIVRPDLSKLVGKTSVHDLFAKRGGLLVGRNGRQPSPTDPNPAGYFHCTTSYSVNAYGCDAWLNCWDPVVDIPSSPGDDHSISQTWLQARRSGPIQSIEAGVTVDHNLNGDAASHLFTYFTTNGYAADGDDKGGYNRLHQGWVQVHSTVFPGLRIDGSSTLGGAQLELGIKFQLSQGNWWFGIDTGLSWTWIGYYPATLFNDGIADYADWVGFGGEVYCALANPCGTTDQMGSGRKADAGWTYAAYQRNLRYQPAADGTMSDFDGTAKVDAAASGCPTDGYTIEPFMASGSLWGSYHYWGGPAEGWETLGGQIVGPIRSIAWSANRLDLFVHGTDNGVWHKWWDGTQWGPSQTGWESLGGGIVGEIAGVAWGANRLDLFARGTDDAVWHKWWDGTQWGPSQTGWESLGGVVTSDPCAVSWGAGRLDLFARGTDGGVWHKWWDAADDARWDPSVTGWESLGGGVSGDVKAVAWGPQRLDLFVHGTDNAIWHKWWDGVWGPSVTGWESLGGQSLGDVEAVAWGPDRLDLFVHGTDNALWHKWWDGAWGPSVTSWESLGGVIVDDPTAIAWGPGRLDVFAEGTDTAVWHKWWDGVWGPSVTSWESLGARISARQSGVARTANRLDLFVRGTDDAVWHKWWDGQNWLPA